VTAPPALLSLLRTPSLLLVALLVMGAGALRGDDPPAAPSPIETLALSPGISLEREIQGGSRSAFGLPLDARTFLYLEIFQRGTSLAPRLLGPGGEVMASGAGASPQLLAMVADREGTYQLELSTPEAQSSSKRFTLKVLELRPATPGDEERVQAAKSLAEARRLSELDNQEATSQAEALIAGSMAAWQTAGDVRGEIEALLERARLRRHQRDLQGALGWYEKVLERSQAHGFAEGAARALSGMGACQGLLGNHDQAIELLKKSRDIWRQTGGAYEQVSALQVLGLAYQRKKDYQAELQTFEEAVPLADVSGDLAQQSRLLSGLGASHYYLGRPSQAREIWEKGLRLSRQAGDVETETLLENNLAVLYHNQGQFQRALDLYSRLIPRVLLKDSGLMRDNMGNLYAELGNHGEALENYQLAREAYHAAGDLEAEVSALVNIGRARQRMGEPQAALAELEKARKMLPQAPWGVFHSIGLAQIDLGRPGEALPVLRKALAIAETEDRSREAATLLALGSAYAELGQTEQATESLKQAIEVGTEIGYQSAVSEALLKRASLLEGRSRFEEALADVQKAMAGIESTRRNIPGDRLRIGFFASKRTYYDLEIGLLMELDRLHPGKYRAQALEASERARARGLLDLLAEGRIDVSQGLDSDLRQREEDLFYRISRAQIELRSGAAKSERVRELQEELRRLDREREQLDLDIRARNRRYADVRYPIPLKLAQIQSLIPDDQTALLEYALGGKRPVLFVVTRKEISTYELPSAPTITKQVERLRKALERNSLLTRKDYVDSAFQLYRDLLLPASQALQGKSNLLIAADGPLHYIPFEALLAEPAAERPDQDLPYLLHRYAIAYIPSASVLAGLREPRQDPVPVDRRQVAAFAPFATSGNAAATREGLTRATADPEANRWSFDPLPASREEVSRITGLYPGTSLSFVGKEANEEAVMRNPAVAGARLLHFATHAKIDETSPERSALVLAERTGEDGFLTVPEIFNLKLSADLAVLSACQTALGKEVTGEGLVGLSRAFFYAGVPSLIVSLWNVVDGSTPDLMLDFYQNLDRMQDKVKALQAAKLSMISRREYAHPSYWAPFILLGEPR
jgi:CHAT domain-containing protein